MTKTTPRTKTRAMSGGVFISIGLTIFILTLVILRQLGVPTMLVIILSLSILGIPLFIISNIASKYSRMVRGVIVNNGYKFEADYDKIIKLVNTERISIDAKIFKKYIRYQAVGMIFPVIFLAG